MKSLKTLSFTALAALAATAPADAYFRAAFKIDKSYRQYGSSSAPTFRIGSGRMYVVDGLFTITGCRLQSSMLNGVLDGALAPFGINPMMGCNLGSTGAIVGFNPGTRYFEIAGLEAATTVEPGRPDLVTLDARPYSEFPARVSGITGNPLSVFYDLTSSAGSIREYRLAGSGAANGEFESGYEFTRTYTSRNTMEKEIVEGVYRFKFPTLNRPTIPLYLSFPVKNTVEGYVTKPIKQGFRFVNVPAFNSSGFAQYGIDEVMQFRWEGFTSNLVLNGDRLYLSFRKLTNPNDPTSAPVSVDDDGIFFPPRSLTSSNVRILLPSPVQNYFNIPADFIYSVIQTSGDPDLLAGRFLLVVELVRDPEINLSVASTRNFELPIQLVATFPGAMAAAFPEGTSSSVMAKDADPDGDGISNWIEWLSGTDPTKANAPKTLSSMSFVPPTPGKDGEPGFWQMTLERPERLVSTAKITVESSADLKTWTTIGASDAEWEVVDIATEPQIVVKSKVSSLASKRYFRAKYVYTP